MAILSLSNPTFDAIVSRYYADMQALADSAISGEITERQYRQEQERLTEAAILAVFLLAGGRQNSPEGNKFLGEQQQLARDSSMALATDLFDGRYNGVEGFDSLLKRLELWTYNLGAAHQIGLVTAVVLVGQPEPRLTWLLGSTKKHCDTCLEQSGQTRARSEWAALAAMGIHPQGRGLTCGGWRCGCILVQV